LPAVLGVLGVGGARCGPGGQWGRSPGGSGARARPRARGWGAV